MLVVLPEPRRLRNENDNDLDDCEDEGLLDGPGNDGCCCCVTNDESKLYAGVDGSDGVPVKTGDDRDAEWDIVENGRGCDT